MSINAQVAVLEIGKHLTGDEFKLLMTIAATAGTVEDKLFPHWPSIKSTTGYSTDMCNRLLLGLMAGRRIVIGSGAQRLVDQIIRYPHGACVHSSVFGITITRAEGSSDGRSDS